MAKKDYKVGESIEVFYQAAGAGTGLVVNMKVFDETGVEDVGQAAVMVEMGVSGRYKASFTPDAVGDWSIQISDANGGEAVKHYSVGSHNVGGIGDAVATLDGKVDALDAKIDAIDAELDNLTSPPMIG